MPYSPTTMFRFGGLQGLSGLAVAYGSVGAPSVQAAVTEYLVRAGARFKELAREIAEMGEWASVSGSFVRYGGPEPFWRLLDKKAAELDRLVNEGIPLEPMMEKEEQESIVAVANIAIDLILAVGQRNLDALAPLARVGEAIKVVVRGGIDAVTGAWDALTWLKGNGKWLAVGVAALVAISVTKSLR